MFRFNSIIFVAALFCSSVNVLAQETITTPDGQTVTLPPGMSAEQKAKMMEQMMKARGAQTPGPNPANQAAKGKKPDEKAKGGDGKEKKGEEAKPEGPAGDIKRSNEPPEEADPTELEVTPNSEGLLSFQFRNQPWPSVLEWYSDVCNLSFDWQELPGDYINLATQRPHSLEETGDMINRALLMRGFTMLLDDETLTVAKIEGLNPSLVPRVPESELPSLPPHRYVRTSFSLSWLLAEEVHQEFASMISKNGQLTPLQSTNRLEGMDAVANLRDIYDILQREQSGIAMENLAKEFPLKHARASNVKDQLQQFLGLQNSGGGGGGSPMSSGSARMMQQQMQQMQQQMQRAMQQQQQKGGAAGATRKARSDRVYLVANERSNSVIVHAPPNKMAIIAAFITRVDVRNENAEDFQRLNTRMKVFRLAALSPTELVNSLNAMDVLEPATRLQVNEDNNSIIAYASVADQFVIQEVITRLDGSEREFDVIQLRRLKADEVAGTIKMLMGADEEEDDSSSRRRNYYYDPWGSSNSSQKKSKDKMRVGANVQDNQLILWVNEIEMNEINKLLEKLGEIPSGESRKRTVRVIDASRQPETYEYLLRLKEQWDRVSPNPLVIPDAAEFEEKKPEDAASQDTSESEGSDDAGQDDSDEAGGESEGGPSSANEKITGGVPTEHQEPGLVGKLTSSPFMQSDTPNAKDEGKQPAKKVNSAVEGKTKTQTTSAQGQRAPSDGRSNLQRAQEMAPPAVKIFLDAGGNLVIQSEDTEALDRLEGYMQSNKPPKRPYDVFKVKYARASWVTLNLEEYFEKNKDSDSDFPFFFFGYGNEEEDKESQLGDKVELKFIWDNDTNTIVVQNADDLDRQTIKDLIELWDVPEEVDTSRIRYTKLIRIKYSRAENIVNTIKEAYRDLLSANDKTFTEGEDGGDEESKRSGGGSASGDGFNFSGLKGKLSLGPDTLTNSILVSVEGKELMEIVENVIQELDVAAEDQGQVEVYKLTGGMNGASLKKALQAILGSKQPGQQKQNPNQQPGQGQNAEAAAQAAEAAQRAQSNRGGRRGRNR
ncbi:MAG: secretin N-terminal domain-containing protein [Pirellulaceae bacterium]